MHKDPELGTVHGITCHGGVYVTAGAGGVMAESTDLVDWERIPPLTTALLRDVKFLEGAFCTVGNSAAVLRGTLETASLEPPTVEWDRTLNVVRLTWPDSPDVILESTTSDQVPFAPVPGATSPHLVDLATAPPTTLFRLAATSP